MTKEDVDKQGFSAVDLAGELLILTGPPGSGKTTTAQALAKQPGSPKVHLHADDFWHFIKNGTIAPYLPEAHEQNRSVVDILAKAAEGYAKNNYLSFWTASLDHGFCSRSKHWTYRFTTSSFALRSMLPYSAAGNEAAIH